MLPGMETTTIRLSLELRLGGDALSGCAADEAGRRVPFLGWLGLIAAIGRFVDPVDDRGVDEGAAGPAGGPHIDHTRRTP